MIRHLCNHLTILLAVILLSTEATVLTEARKKVVKDAADGGSLQMFYIRDDVGLVQVANKNYHVTGEFLNGEHAIAVDYHWPRDLLLWSTSSGELFSCPLQRSRQLAYATNVSLVYRDSKWYPGSLAVDHLDDLIYVLDTRTNGLRVVDLDGRLIRLLGLGKRSYRPLRLELDAAEGFLFLVDVGQPADGRYTHILRMRMDGTEAKIIDPPPINIEILTGQMTLDRINKRILISSRRQSKIFSFDYDGKDAIVLLEGQNGTTAMSVSENELFWVNAVYHRQGTAFRDGSVYRCAYEAAKGCLANSTEKILDSLDSGYVKDVRVVEPASQTLSQVSKRSCKNACEYSCFKGTCVCRNRWKLSDDGKSCEPVKEFLLYENEKIVRGVCLGKGVEQCQPIEPLVADIWFKKKERSAFDYDSTTRQLYYGGQNAIYRVDLDTGAKTRLLYQRGVFYGPLAVDWVTKNLYFTEIEQRGNVSFYILKAMSALTDDAQQSSSLLWELGKIHSIAVHPYKGYIFFSTFDLAIKNFRMMRLRSDASNLTVLLGLKHPTFVSLDYVEDKIYVLNANKSEILRANLNGQKSEKVASIDDPRNVTGFLYHEGIIYVKNRTSIGRLDVGSGNWLSELRLFPYDRDMNVDLRIHSEDSFGMTGAMRDAHPCAVNNGGCDNFCFAVPRTNSTDLTKICRCYDGVRCKVKSST